jgi:hypothetical protein
MQKLIVLFVMVYCLEACQKEKFASTTILNENADTVASIIQMGVFADGPYGSVSGKAFVLRNADNSYSVQLDSFMTSNGPDLHVYLSKQAMPVDFINLGKLKSTAGRQVYEVPGNPDLSAFKFVCIHCKAYNHLFGSARIQ